MPSVCFKMNTSLRGRGNTPITHKHNVILSLRWQELVEKTSTLLVLVKAKGVGQLLASHHMSNATFFDK